MNKTEDKKQALLAKRDELLERLVAIEDDYRRGLDRDAEEQAIQLENAEVLNGIAQAAKEELERIEEELEKLE